MTCSNSVKSSSVAQSCLTFCDPMDWSMPGLPVHHQLSEFTQTQIHLVGDAIQPSHPLLSPSPSAFNLSQDQGFSNQSVLHIRGPKYWSFSFSISPSKEHPGLISFRMDWLVINNKCFFLPFLSAVRSMTILYLGLNFLSFFKIL